MGKLSPLSYERLNAKRQERHGYQDSLVLDALGRLGGSFVGRSMDLAKHCTEILKESHIKDALLRLVKAGKVQISGTDNSRKKYEVIG